MGEPAFSHGLFVLEDTSDALGEAEGMKITPAADMLLRRFHKTNTTFNLWIDGVSLNQADQAEIAQQISMMGEIYSESTRVRVRLGSIPT